MYKKIILLTMIAVSFRSEAMFNNGLKNIIKKSMLQKTAIRTMNSGKEQETKHIIGIIQNCTSMVYILGGCIMINRFFPAINTPEAMRERIEYLEELDAKKKLKSEKKSGSNTTDY